MNFVTILQMMQSMFCFYLRWVKGCQANLVVFPPGGLYMGDLLCDEKQSHAALPGGGTMPAEWMIPLQIDI